MRHKVQLMLTVILCLVLTTGCGIGRFLPSGGDSSSSADITSVINDTQAKKEKMDPVIQGAAFESAFYYSLLNQYEKIWYDEMLIAISQMKGKTALSKAPMEYGLGEEDLSKIFGYVLNDHPELFYIDGFSYTTTSLGDAVIGYEFNGAYTIDEAEAKRRTKEIEKAVSDILSLAPSGDAYEKEKYIYETIIANTEYNIRSSDNQNIYSVLVNHASVCQGYAKTFQYLMQRLGINCILVNGSVSTGELHAWNYVCIGDRYYLVDSTWGDPSYAGSTVAAGQPQISYDYLNANSEDVADTHIANEPDILPLCVSRQDNYYMREGMYFYFFDENSLKVQFGFLASRGYVSLKCENEDIYDTFRDELVTKGRIFEFVDQKGTFHYTANAQMHTMTFWVTNNE